MKIHDYFNNMTEEVISQEFRFKETDKTRNDWGNKEKWIDE